MFDLSSSALVAYVVIGIFFIILLGLVIKYFIESILLIIVVCIIALLIEVFGEPQAWFLFGAVALSVIYLGQLVSVWLWRISKSKQLVLYWISWNLVLWIAYCISNYDNLMWQKILAYSPKLVNGIIIEFSLEVTSPLIYAGSVPAFLMAAAIVGSVTSNRKKKADFEQKEPVESIENQKLIEYQETPTIETWKKPEE